MRYLIALILFISSVSVNAQLINGTEIKIDTASIKTNAARELYVDSNYIKLFSGSSGGGNYLPLAGGTMEPGASIFFGTGGQNISQGTFDNGTGGNNGISLNCAVGYELNWQGGHLSSSFSGGNYVPIIIDSNLIIKSLSGGGVRFVTTDNNGNLGTAPFISLPIQDADVFDPDYGNVRDAIIAIDFDQGQTASEVATLNGQVTTINSAIADVVSFSDTLTTIATKEDLAGVSGGSVDLSGYALTTELTVWRPLSFTGVVDGANDAFVIDEAYTGDASVYVSGQKLTNGSRYTQSGDNIVVAERPDNLEIWGNAPPTSILANTGKINQVHISIDETQAQFLNSSPVSIISAPGTNKAIRILDAVFKLNFSSPAYSFDDILYLYTDGVALPFTNYQLNMHNFINASSSTIRFAYVDIADIQNAGDMLRENAPVMLSGETDQITGNSTIDIYITYEIITL